MENQVAQDIGEEVISKLKELNAILEKLVRERKLQELLIKNGSK